MLILARKVESWQGHVEEKEVSSWPPCGTEALTTSRKRLNNKVGNIKLKMVRDGTLS